jgi:ribosome-associated protein
MGTALLILKGTSIPLSELTFRFSRSGGHGGQNVNKVETRVELLFDVDRSPSLTEPQREMVLQHLRSRIDDRGIFRIIAQRSRNQWTNRQEAIERFIGVMQKALTPKKVRRATKATGASKEQRLQQKKRRGEIKQSRRARE